MTRITSQFRYRSGTHHQTDNLMNLNALSDGMKGLSSSERYGWRFIAIICIIALCFIGNVSGAVTGDKDLIPTTITLTLSPENPGADEGFFITGTLATKDGEPLGNKVITLESTKAGARPGPFGFLKTVSTTQNGTYSFYRPPSSPSEKLRVVFKGNYIYNATTSDEISVRQASSPLTEKKS